MGQSAALSADPKTVFAARNGVHNVISQTCFLDLSPLSFTQPKEPSIDRSEPCATFRICINWSIAVRRKALRNGIGHKCTVAEALKAARTAHPDVSFPVLKQGGDRVALIFSQR